MHHNRRVLSLNAADGRLCVTTASRTSAGRVRDHNEDSLLDVDGVYVIADGMGGHAAGDVASALAIETLAKLATAFPLTSAQLVEAVRTANSRIVEDAVQNTERSGMGTTCVGLVATTFSGLAHWLGFNVGDSRLYELTPAAIRRLSVDHSEVQELIDAGRIQPEEAFTHPLRHVVTRSLGTEPCPPVDVWMFPAVSGITFLLCSDGLTDELTEDAVHRIFLASTDLDDLARGLVAAAEDAGGHDNVSVVLVRVDAESEQLHSDEADTNPRIQLTPTS